MNRRRLVAIIAAALLTIFGTVVLIAYVNSAEDRALAGAELVGMLVAAEEIPAGTPAASLAGSQSVTRVEVPRAVRPPDAVTDLNELGDQVTLERILEGEPIVARQFGAPEDFGRGDGQAVEEGLEIITVALEPQRALGGEISEGDLVGVIVSVEGSGGGGGEEDPATATDPSSGGGDEATSAMVLAGVPVMDVSGGSTGAAEDAGQPSDVIMVSLQVDEPDAERIAFGAEFGRLWLTRQGEGEDTDSQRRTRSNVFPGSSGGG